MAPGPKKKTLEKRFANQATRLLTKGTASGGKQLKEKEIVRRGMAQARRHSARAKVARAEAGTRKGAKLIKKAVVPLGKPQRARRTLTNSNAVTGAKQSPLKTARKAVKKSVSRGKTSQSQGNKALRDLTAMDPTARRTFLGIQSIKASRASGDFRNKQGKNISKSLSAIRRAAKGAGKASTAKKTTKKTNNGPNRKPYNYVTGEVIKKKKAVTRISGMPTRNPRSGAM